MKSPSEIIGVDPGLTMPGIAALDPRDGKLLRVASFKGQGTSPTLNASYRVHALVADMFKWIIQTPGTKVVGIEGASKGPGWQAIESLGRFRQGIFQACVYYLEDFEHFELPPTSVKRSFTGHGHASKDSMVAMAVRRYRVTLSKTNKAAREAEADAIAIADLTYSRWNRRSRENG